MKRIQFKLCFVGADKKPARWCTYFDISKMTIIYVVRAGRKGRGEVMAREKCLWGSATQGAAIKKIEKKLKQVVFAEVELKTKP